MSHSGPPQTSNQYYIQPKGKNFSRIEESIKISCYINSIPYKFWFHIVQAYVYKDILEHENPFSIASVESAPGVPLWEVWVA